MTDLPLTAHPGRGFSAWLGRQWLRLNGWTIGGTRPDVKKAVIVAAPHTSNWDLAYTLACAAVLNMRIRWVGKQELFAGPMGPLMRALGGLPVDRSQRTNAVQAIAALFDEHDELFLIIPPEGTRSKAGRWKTGFYWIAIEAAVPIILGYVDFGRGRGGLGEIFEPTGDIEADFESLRAFYSDIRGKKPELQGEISLGERERDEAARRRAEGEAEAGS